MQNYHKYLIWVVIATLVLLSVFLVARTDQVLKTATTTNTVSFSGEGKVLARPDVAVVSLSIVTEATTSKAAQDDNSAKSKTVTDFLKKQGIEEKDIKTSGYNIYPQYFYPRNNRPEIQGYQVNQALEIKIRDLDKISEVLDGIVSAGVNQVDNLSLQIDNPDALRSEAREKAIEGAKKKAQELESQLDVNLGRIVNFSENTGGIPTPLYYGKSEAMGIGGGGPSIPTGENEIVVNVTITYQIK